MCCFTELLNPDDLQVLAAPAVTATVPVAVYYLKIDKKLIGHLLMRHEPGALSGQNTDSKRIL